jgi:hypothetical protein
MFKASCCLGEQVNPDIAIAALGSALLVAAVAVVIHRYLTRAAETAVRTQVDATRESERQLHLIKMEHLSDRNEVAVKHAEALTQARAVAFEEGRKQALAEHEAEISMRLAQLRSEMTARIGDERETAANEARERLRAEYELQNKLFSVKISPYVELVTDNGFFKKTHDSKLGYQFQLLVNGIPVFQPHVCVERHERIDVFDEEVKRGLLTIAQGLAEAAAKTYLGGNVQFAKLAPGIVVDRLAN